jgi:hypothetical protein
LPAPGFSISVVASSLTLQAGQSVTTTVTITSQGGFASAVSFAWVGLPSGATCSFSPATVTPSGSTASTTLTVATAKSSASLGNSGRPLLPEAALAALLCGLGLRSRRRWTLFLLLVLSAIGVSLLNGCGGGSPSGGGTTPQPVSSTVTITAGAGLLQHTTTFSLTVH